MKYCKLYISLNKYIVVVVVVVVTHKKNNVHKYSKRGLNITLPSLIGIVKTCTLQCHTCRSIGKTRQR